MWRIISIARFKWYGNSISFTQIFNNVNDLHNIVHCKLCRMTASGDDLKASHLQVGCPRFNKKDAF